MVLGLSAQNSGFEDDIVIEWDNTGVSPVARSTEQAHSGEASLKTALPAGNFQSQRPQWPASTDSPAPGVPVSAEGWVYASSSVAVEGNIFLECWGGGEIVGYETTSTEPLPNGVWTHISGDITAPEGTTGWKVLVWVARTGGDLFAEGDVFYVDDVQVEVVLGEVPPGPGWYVGHPMGA